MSAATVDGYRQEKVTLQELFSGGKGKIKEPSVKALRQRALDGILVYLDSSGQPNISTVGFPRSDTEPPEAAKNRE